MTFTSLRKRGGNLADLAILVIDINEGLKPQTAEAIEILKAARTPFVIAANKVDLIQENDDFFVFVTSEDASLSSPVLHFSIDRSKEVKPSGKMKRR